MHWLAGAELSTVQAT